MNEPETSPDDARLASEPASRPRQWTWTARVGLFWAGVIVPVQCVVCGLWGISSYRKWQSGEIRTYAALLLSLPTIPFWPLLIYGMVALVLLLVDFARWSDRLIVRWGIYSGTLLAAQYFVIVALGLNGAPRGQMTSWSEFALATAIAVGSAIVVFGGLALTPARNYKWLNIGIGVVLTGLGMVPTFFLIPLLFGAAWASCAYALVSWWLLRRPRVVAAQFDLQQLFGICGWFAAYSAAWRASYTWMLAEYAKLPTGPPGCYIATAAARGHRRLVGSRPACGAGGEFLANDQLRYFKVAELALLCAAPRVHRAVRGIYDWVGVALARRIQQPFLADATYLALKPAEWFVRLLLPRFAREAARRLWRA